MVRSFYFHVQAYRCGILFDDRKIPARTCFFFFDLFFPRRSDVSSRAREIFEFARAIATGAIIETVAYRGRFASRVRDDVNKSRAGGLSRTSFAKDREAIDFSKLPRRDAVIRSAFSIGSTPSPPPFRDTFPASIYKTRGRNARAKVELFFRAQCLLKISSENKRARTRVLSALSCEKRQRKFGRSTLVSCFYVQYRHQCPIIHRLYCSGIFHFPFFLFFLHFE